MILAYKVATLDLFFDGNKKPQVVINTKIYKILI